MEELCLEGHEAMKAMGIKEGMARREWRRTVVLGGILLGVRPMLAWMPDIPCVFGILDVKRI